MTQQDREEIISRIIYLEFQITSAIIDGHKSSIDDHFKDKRIELSTLRCLLFGYNSGFCKKK